MTFIYRFLIKRSYLIIFILFDFFLLLFLKDNYIKNLGYTLLSMPLLNYVFKLYSIDNCLNLDLFATKYLKKFFTVTGILYLSLICEQYLINGFANIRYISYELLFISITSLTFRLLLKSFFKLPFEIYSINKINKIYFVGSNYVFEYLKKKFKFLNFVFYDQEHNITLNKKDLLVFEDINDSQFSSSISKNKIYSKKLSLYDFCTFYLEKYPYELMKNYYSKKRNSGFYFLIKRFFDIGFSLIILIIFSPLVLFFSLLIFIEDGMPILYSQERTGLKERTFKIYKLRSMNKSAEEDGPQWSKENDSRVLKIGKFIRKTRIDELPQLFNVINGDLSLIGPRPERPEFDNILKNELNSYMKRYKLKPGISGLAQVEYPYGSSREDAKNKLDYDLFYQENISLILDLIIFFKTLKVVFNIFDGAPNND